MPSSSAPTLVYPSTRNDPPDNLPHPLRHRHQSQLDITRLPRPTLSISKAIIHPILFAAEIEGWPDDGDFMLVVSAYFYDGTEAQPEYEL